VRYARVQLRPIFAALWRDKLIIAACVILAAALSVVYALTRKPLFESEAIVASAEKDSSQFAALSGILGQFGGLASTLGMTGSVGAGVDETIAILQGRDFTLRFLRRNEILPHLFPEMWDEKTGAWRSGGGEAGFGDWLRGLIDGGSANASTSAPSSASATAGNGAAKGEPSGEKAVERFALLRQITVDRRTGFIKLAVRARTPQLAHDWAAALIRDVNAELRERALVESRRTAELLTEKLGASSHEVVRSTAATLLEAQLKTEVLAQAREDYALRILDPPSVPEQRWYPKRKRIVLLGMIMGVLLGVAFSIGRHAFAGYRRVQPAS
jgi:LPS O-antigen subunit length determinant protein (WzzB/FepE family)